MSKKRGKKSTKKGSLGRDYAPLYEPVMRTQAVRSLPLSAYKLWTVAVVLCKPWLNGAVPLTRNVLADFGLVNSQAVTSGLKLLIDLGLVVQTRKAVSRRCALFGVAHLQFNKEAMAAAGASDPRNSRTTCKSASADCSSVGERTDHQSTKHQIDKFVDCSSVQNPPISTTFVDCSSVTSKNLPCGTAQINGMPEGLRALLERVRAAGGTVTAADRLRVRWCNGDPPQDLAGELELHSKELFIAMESVR